MSKHRKILLRKRLIIGIREIFNVDLEIFAVKLRQMEPSRLTRSDHKNTEDIAIKTSTAAESETLDDKTLSPSIRGSDIVIPEIRVQHHRSDTDDYKNPSASALDYLAVDMCSSVRTTALKISNCNAVARKISEASVVKLPDGSKLKPDESRERRRKRSLSLDPEILLHWAATHNDIDTLKTLLESTKIDINEPGVDGFSLLHRAASTGSLECLQYLVTKGAQLEVCDKDGSSPLDAAVSEGEFDCARFLIEKGANIHHIRDGFMDKDLIRIRGGKRGMTIL